MSTEDDGNATGDGSVQDTTQPTNQESDAQDGEVHSVLLNAEKKIDLHLNHLKNSRRLYYRENSTSWAHLTTSLLKTNPTAAEEAVEEPEEKKAVVRGQYGDFLASRVNVKVVQRDMAEAEELFYNQNGAETSGTTEPDSLAPKFKMQLFNPIYYDNIEHTWNKKPFTVDSMRTFFGTIREDRMDKLIKSKRSKIAKNGSWDPEGLVLTDLGRPFRCKLFFSVNDAENLPKSFKIERLSGVWLSKVYSGEYGKFADWVDDAIKYVKQKYGRKVNAHRNFFAYYPSALENQKSPDESLVVFFIKISG